MQDPMHRRGLLIQSLSGRPAQQLGFSCGLVEAMLSQHVGGLRGDALQLEALLVCTDDQAFRDVEGNGLV